MSTAIGNHMLGSGKQTCGRGIVRNVASSVVSHIGNALVNKLASAIRGNGVRITGGRKKTHKVGRPRKATTHRKRR